MVTGLGPEQVALLGDAETEQRDRLAVLVSMARDAAVGRQLTHACLCAACSAGVHSAEPAPAESGCPEVVSGDLMVRNPNYGQVDCPACAGRLRALALGVP